MWHSMTSNVLMFQELEFDGTVPGRSIALHGYQVVPLNFEDLRMARLHEPIQIKLDLTNATIAKSDVTGLEVGARVGVTATLESRYAARAIGLVPGGWLPSGLALRTDSIVFPDRNVLSDLKATFEAGTARMSPRAKDFRELFADQSVRVSAILFALEGNKRTLPSDIEAIEQLDEAHRILRRALPKAELFEPLPVQKAGLLGLLSDRRKGLDRKVRFLMELAPKLESNIRKPRISALWQEVREIADIHQIAQDSLLVLAVLSTVSMPNGSSPARRMLKFRPGYTEEDAYNALTDIQSLELFACMLATSPTDPLMLCTADKDLALFWVGLNANDFRWIDGHLRFELNPISLLPTTVASLWGVVAEL